jgi:MobA/MobL family
MAIYHVSAKIISRSGGKSVLAAAAYRAGDLLTDVRLGTRFDYTKKQGVDSTVILAPENAPEWVSNREKLWNQVEAAENRKDSQLAREFNIALPVELNKEQMKNLAFEYVQEQFVNLGMIADVAFHDLDSDNPHFHVLLTMREITEQGFSKKKNRDWNSTELLVEHREAWATHVNAALENLGRVQEKIDHRTLVAQGITDRIAQVHLGPELHRIREEYLEAADLEGFRSKYQIGDLYETINEINLELASSHAALEELNELIAIEYEAMEEIKQQTTSLPSAQNITMNPNEKKEESDRERECSSTAEPINLSERLSELTDYFTSSSREATDSGRKLQSLADRLRGGREQVGESREPNQSIREPTAEGVEPTTEQPRRPQKPNQRIEKGAGEGTRNSQQRDPEQSENLQQKLSSHLGSGTEGQGKFERTTEQAISAHVTETGGSNSNPDQSPQLELNQAISPKLQSNRTNQGTGEQHRNQAQSSGETEKSLSDSQRQSDLNHLAAISTIVRLMQDLDEETFEGQRYRLKVSPDFSTVQMYALDGRGLILEQKDGQIKGQLLDEDLKAIEHLNQQLDQREGQRQVNRCLPVFVKLLNYVGQYKQNNSVYFLSFDFKTQIMTYRSKENPSSFLVAQQTQQGWEYMEGKLPPVQEQEISVDLDEWLEQQALQKAQKKERGRGFSR